MITTNIDRAQVSYILYPIISPIFQKRRLKLGEVKWFAQGLRTGKRLSRDSNTSWLTWKHICAVTLGYSFTDVHDSCTPGMLGDQGRDHERSGPACPGLRVSLDRTSHWPGRPVHTVNWEQLEAVLTVFLTRSRVWRLPLDYWLQERISFAVTALGAEFSTKCLSPHLQIQPQTKKKKPK